MSEVIAFIVGVLCGSGGVICCALCVANKGGDKNE